MKRLTLSWKPITYIYGFMFIFNPSIIPGLNMIYILFLMSIPIIAANFSKFNHLLLKKRIFLFITVNLLFILFLAIYYVAGFEDTLIRLSAFLLIIINTICALTLYLIYSKTYPPNSIYTIINFFISLGGIQLFFVIISIIFPQFRDWVLSNQNLNELSNDLGSGLRSYGFASGFTSTFPMFMGLCSIFSLYLYNETKGIYKKLYYLTLTLLFIFSIVINARIGLVPIILWAILSPLYLIYRKKIGSLLLLLSISFILTPLIFVKYGLIESQLFFRLNQGITEIQQLISGNKTGTFETLSDMWFFPDKTFNLLFGEGIITIGNFSKSSDIGLIQDIYMYGLLPTILLTLFLVYFTYPMFKEFSDKFGAVFCLVIIISIISYYFKGMVFYSNAVTNCLLLMSIVAINYRKVGYRVIN